MSFYRNLLAAVAAIAIASPVFADDTATTQTPAADTTATQPAATDGAQQTSSNDQSSTESKVNINKASAKELMKVKGLNASKARAIVAYRKKHGDFKSVDDLSNVKGFKKVKPDTLKEIQGQLVTE